MPNYAIRAQTRTVFLPIVHGRADKELVEWHLIDLDLGVRNPLAICGESIDLEYTREHPQSLRRWAALGDSHCKKCDGKAGRVAGHQAEDERAALGDWRASPA